MFIKASAIKSFITMPIKILRALKREKEGGGAAGGEFVWTGAQDGLLLGAGWGGAAHMR